MEIEITRSNPDIALLKVTGEIDRLCGSKLMAALDKAKDSEEIHLDLSLIGYVGSAFVDTLVMFRNRLPENDAKIRIINPSPDVLEIFRITNLDRIFPVIRT